MRPSPAGLSPARARGFWLGASPVLFAAAVGLALPLASLFRLVPRSYNEGWNAYWAMIAWQGGTLYQGPDSVLVNNYPPLSFYLVGLLGFFTGDNVVAGRLISVAGLAVVTLAVHTWLKASGASREACLAGASFCVVTFATFGQGYIATNDPQLLGHAFVLGGLAVLWRYRFSPTALAAGATLMLLGVFTKHLMFPLPIVTTVWIAIRHRRRMLTWLGVGVAGVVVGSALSVLCGGTRFFQELFSARAYSWTFGLSATLLDCGMLLPLLLLAALPYARALRSKEPLAEGPRFLLPYLLLSLCVGALASGGQGIARNVFFDLVIAASLAAALGLDEMLRLAPSPRLRGVSPGVAILILLGFGIAINALVTVPKTWRAIRALGAVEHDARQTMELITRLGQGRAVCETLQLCYWARAPFTLDLFNYGQKLETGLLPVAPCVKALREGAYPVLQLESPEARTVRLGDCGAAIQQYYIVIWRSRVGTVLVPRGTLDRARAVTGSLR